ncbi:uncharacterized protein BDZ99DRAFT_478109 [Mytilinidion resinicola]|uniref:Uncharacterized protein n=1 Tax=Mytilinidion resinicola TaxID=574789 RepID=A0A6A6YJB7_9PEZI|nr:uncharacterized protein BDZ99DRAFT_478109 [Mytilinidion resinicola]KAF2808648.1 hypothetical protein BDZ99DRAFT_478109 [Mytilinidion resinicola]
MNITLERTGPNLNRRVKATGATTGDSASALAAFGAMGSQNVHRESQALFFRENTFRLLEMYGDGETPYQIARAFMKAIGPGGRKQTRNIELHNVGSVAEGIVLDPDTLEAHRYCYQVMQQFQIVTTQLSLCKNLQSLFIYLDTSEVFGSAGPSPQPLVEWLQPLWPIQASAGANRSDFEEGRKRCVAAAKVRHNRTCEVNLTLGLLIFAAKSSGLKKLAIAWKADQKMAAVFQPRTSGGPSKYILRAGAEDFLRAYLQPACAVVPLRYLDKD